MTAILYKLMHFVDKADAIRLRNYTWCFTRQIKPAHEILVLIAYAQMYLINAHVNIASKARGLNFGLRLNLQPYFV